ncbi:MAG: hypothetical protein U0790_29675, partial [Isosphaeraceae bacterium]
MKTTAAFVLAYDILASTAVPSSPPFALLRTASRMSTTPEVRVVVAIWPDGHILRATDGGRYDVGLLRPEALEHLVCEIEAIDLWNYSTDGPPILQAAEDLWLRRGAEAKGWVQAIGDPQPSLPAFGESRSLLLTSAYEASASIEWNGIAPPGRTTAGASVATPRCRQLVDPNRLLTTLRSESARDVVSR